MKTVLIAISLLLINPFTITNSIADEDRAKQGTAACGGNHVISRRTSQAHRSGYVLRNHSETQAINIDRIRFFDAQANVIAEYVAPDLPLFDNRVLGPNDTLLLPNETAQLRSQSIFGNSNFGRSLRPFQMRIDWSSAEKVLTLGTTHVRTVNSISISYDQFGQEVIDFGVENSRHSGKCREIKRKK